MLTACGSKPEDSEVISKPGGSVSENVVAFEASGELHILGSYWGFLLMGLHLGLHWSMILGAIKKKWKLPKSVLCSVAAKIISTLVAIYGLTVFVRRDFITYMF